MKRILYLLILIISVLTMTCSEDDVSPREYPRVRTLEVSDISASGARFNAEILHPGNSGITEYGFVWGPVVTPTINSSDRVIFNGSVNGNKFHQDVLTTLEEGIEYYVRAYARDDEYLVYGPIKSFISLGSGGPVLTSASPEIGTLGDTIVISGENFSYVRSSNQVYFDTIQAEVLLYPTDTTLKAIVPDNLFRTDSDIRITINGNSSQGTGTFTLAAPEIDSLSSYAGDVGDTIRIYGKNFGNAVRHLHVFFGDKEVPLVSHSSKKTSVLVPTKSSSSEVLRVQVAHLSDEVEFEYFYPQLIDFEPKQVTWGDTVRVQVRDFGTQNFSLVLNEEEYPVLSKTQDEIRFIVPETLRASSTYITFRAGNRSFSLDERLTLKSPKINSTDPEIIKLGESVVLEVSNLHPSQNGFTLIYYNNQRSIGHTRLSENLVRLNIPADIQIPDLGPSYNYLGVQVDTYNNLYNSRINLPLLAPLIDSIRPLVTQSSEDEVTIYGQNLGKSPDVWINNQQHLVVSASDTQVRIKLQPLLLDDQGISQQFKGTVRILNPDLRRSGWSTEEVTLNHTTALKWESDGNRLYSYANNFPTTRYEYGSWGTEDFGIIIGGIWRGYGIFWTKGFSGFNPSTGRWYNLSQLITPEEANLYDGFVRRGDFLYGFIRGAGNILSVFRYDLINGGWTKLASVPEPVLGQTIMFMEIENSVFVGSAESPKIYEYRFENDSWNDTGAVTPGNFNFTYKTGGEVRVRFLEGDYRFDKTTYSWTTINTESSPSLNIAEHKGKYYLIEEDGTVYDYDPVSRSSQEKIRLPGRAKFIFSTGGKMYFQVYDYPQDMLSYDPDF